GEIGDDMVRPVRIALAVLRHILASAGHDAPAFPAEAHDRCITYAAAGAGEHDGLAIGVSRHAASLAEARASASIRRARAQRTDTTLKVRVTPSCSAMETYLPGRKAWESKRKPGSSPTGSAAMS